MSKPSTPPPVLVETWIKLLHNRDPEPRRRAMQMLRKTFGDMKNVQAFCEQHGISF